MLDPIKLEKVDFLELTVAIQAKNNIEQALQLAQIEWKQTYAQALSKLKEVADDISLRYSPIGESFSLNPDTLEVTPTIPSTTPPQA